MTDIPEYCTVPECTTPVIWIEEDRLTRIPCAEYCIVPELKKLWAAGVKTVCSCCGHGDDDKAYIRVRDESVDKMLEMGYEPYEPHECLYYTGTTAFRAKEVRQMREKGKPTGTRSIEEIRQLWHEGNNIKGENICTM